MNRSILNEYMWIIATLLVGITLLTFGTPFGRMVINEIVGSTIQEVQEYQNNDIDISDNYGGKDMIIY